MKNALSTIFFVLASISAFANESSDSLTVEQELADIKLHHKSLLESCALWAKEDQVEQQELDIYLVKCVYDELGYPNYGVHDASEETDDASSGEESDSSSSEERIYEEHEYEELTQDERHYD